jgi:hypothetical protein
MKILMETMIPMLFITGCGAEDRQAILILAATSRKNSFDQIVNDAGSLRQLIS